MGSLDDFKAMMARQLGITPPSRQVGKAVCPECGKVYVPDLPRGDGEPYQREQHITGLCSDACWRRFLGPDA